MGEYSAVPAAGGTKIAYYQNQNALLEDVPK